MFLLEEGLRNRNTTIRYNSSYLCIIGRKGKFCFWYGNSIITSLTTGKVRLSEMLVELETGLIELMLGEGVVGVGILCMGTDVGVYVGVGTAMLLFVDLDGILLVIDVLSKTWFLR